MKSHAATQALLERGRLLASTGQDEAAKSAYLEVLNGDPTQFDALNELALIALGTGHRSAARTAYRQAVQCHPDNPVGRVNLGNLYFQDGEVAAAHEQYAAALAANADFPEAHQGIARTLDEMGDAAAAELHRQKGFAGRALVVQRYRGAGPGIPVLLLVSARFGNIATQLILDDRMFSVTALYVDYYDAMQPLPTQALIFNAIGDADLCDDTLIRAEAVLSAVRGPVINLPRRVRRTGRVANAERLAGLAGVIAPRVRLSDRRELLAAADLSFPLLLRSPGYHMGTHFLRLERSDELSAAVGALPGERLLAIEYLNAVGADGMARKYRVMFIDGELYPLHLAVSYDWKVHYFSAAMASELRFRQEEERFLEAMAVVLGAAAMAALRAINESLGLDYAGIDFGLSSDGRVLLFEANATMVIVPPPADPMWDYRRAAIDRALKAAKGMVAARARASLP